jgi:hypothetical protein
MNRICWRLIDCFSRMLDPDEREAVCGDLAESRAGAGQALVDVFGLVVRRQAAAFTGFRAWLTLVFLVFPLSMLLSLAATARDDGAVYVWMYANNLRWELLRDSGFWRELGHVAGLLFFEYLTLACLSWTSGFVLGSISRGIAWINGFLFSLMLVFGLLMGRPLYFSFYWHYMWRTFGVTDARFVADPTDPLVASTFYRVVFPLILQMVLVVAPALWGMSKGLGAKQFRPVLRALLWAVALITLALMLVQIPLFGLFVSLYKRPAIWHSWQVRCLHYVVYWPVLYFVVNVIGRRAKLLTASF